MLSVSCNFDSTWSEVDLTYSQRRNVRSVSVFSVGVLTLLGIFSTISKFFPHCHNWSDRSYVEQLAELPVIRIEDISLSHSWHESFKMQKMSYNGRFAPAINNSKACVLPPHIWISWCIFYWTGPPLDMLIDVPDTWGAHFHTSTQGWLLTEISRVKRHTIMSSPKTPPLASLLWWQSSSISHLENQADKPALSGELT